MLYDSRQQEVDRRGNPSDQSADWLSVTALIAVEVVTCSDVRM